jgi:very-short-patch-repair endonuclease
MSCEHENCDLPPKYGKINHTTGRFEKKHCKAHKQEGEKGNAPPWSKRYENFVTIAKFVSFILNISKEEWIAGTKKDGKYFKPKMKCPEGHPVENTSIGCFNRKPACCICSGNFPWSERYEEFKEICKDNGYELLTSKEEWIAGTKKDGKYFKPKMKCPEGHLVENTCIGSFNQKPSCCICNDRVPWSERYEEFKEICKKFCYELLTSKEEWKEGTTNKGCDFKPKMLCPEGHPVENTTIGSFNQKPSCCICNDRVPWSERYEEFKEICKKFCYELLTSKEEWKEGTTNKGCDFKPKMLCPEGHPVENTCIVNFVNRKPACCICSGNVPWIERYEEFKEICKKFCYELLTSKEEWKEGTNKEGKYFKPKMLCPEGHPVENTCIHSFVNSDVRCPKCAMKRSQKLMTEIIEKLYPNNKFQCDFRPSFLKYNKGSNLELDMYCEELKLAFEYDGAQHRKYVKCFHKTEQVFIQQQERDVWKDVTCKELGITLIRIPDKDGEICIDCYNPENMETYIKSQIQ